MSKNQGLKFENEFGRWLAKNHSFVIKLPDTRSLRMKAKAVSSAVGKNFQELTGTKVPGDYWSVKDGKSYLWECKHTNQASFPLGNMKDHQEVALAQHDKAGGQSFVAIAWKSEKCTILNIHQWYYLKELAYTHDRASIPKKWCEEGATKTLHRKTPKHLPKNEDKARYD